MKWSSEERKGLLRKLDAVERVVVTFYQLLLGLIIAAVVVVVVLVITWKPWGAGNQGEWFYFSIVVLLVLGWAVGQLVSLGRRQRQQGQPMTFHSSTAGGARTWEFWYGRPAEEEHQNPGAGHDDIQCELSRSFVVPSASLPAAVLPGEEVLKRLDTELKGGVPIDKACKFVQPAFDDWSEVERNAYRLYVTSQLNHRGSSDLME